MLISFLILPFVFSVLLATFVFIKNPIYIRRLAKTFYLIQFIYSIVMLFALREESFSFLNFNFELDRSSLYILFLANFIFFLFSIISKKFILKLNRAFYAISFLLLGLINLTIFSNNILVILISIFWIFLIGYFLNVSYCKKEAKKGLIIQLTNDIFWVLVSFCLVLYDFARYFILNDIEFSFLNVSYNLYKIDETGAFLGFIGLLIILARLFNLIPFSAKNQNTLINVSPYISTFILNANLILGISLFLKVYPVFDYLFYQIQGILAIFLLFNFIVFAVLSLRQKKMFKFLYNLVNANLIIVLFATFSFEDECLAVFQFCSIALIASYCLSSFVMMTLADKFKSDDFDEITKITDKTKISQFFVLFSMLNFSSTPILAIFSSQIICFAMIFATDYDNVILNVVPFCLVFGAFLLCLAVLGVLYKLLIAPIQENSQVSLCNHQIVVCAILAFVVLLFGIFPDSIFNQIAVSIGVENY